MTEARYRGQKVVVVSPDYADNTKFADEWVSPHPGTDGALGMAMGHVILKEFFIDRQVPRFVDYVKKFSDLPFLVTLAERDGAWVPDKFLTAATWATTARARSSRPCWWTPPPAVRTRPTAPWLPLRRGRDGQGNLDLEGIDPALSFHGATGTEVAEVLPPRFDTGQEHGEGGSAHRRGGRRRD